MVSFCSFKISLLNACTVVIFFMPVSFSLRHERVDPWERIASRWRPVFSSHLVNAVTGKVGASTRSGFSDVLLNHDSSVFVLPQPHKFCMPKPISRRPLQKLNLCNGLRAKPDAFLHFLGSQFVAPSRLVRIGEIDERHRGGNQ